MDKSVNDFFNELVDRVTAYEILHEWPTVPANSDSENLEEEEEKISNVESDYDLPEGLIVE